MQRNFMIVVIAFTLVIFAVSAVDVFADPFISYPGTRARAMGGAFTGIADDASAFWYNPAGIAGGKTEIIAEWSQAVSKNEDNEDEKWNNDENKFFLGFKSSEKKSGWGLFYFSPYTISWYFAPKSEVGTVSGQLEEDMNILGGVFAKSFLDGHLSIGASVEYVLMSHDVEKVRYTDTYYTTSTGEYSNTEGGLSGSIGILGVPIDYKPWSLNVKVGGVYRFPSSASSDEGATRESEAVTEQLLFNKPSSYDVGISVTKLFTKLKSALVLSTQYGITNWSDSNDTIDNDYTKSSFGVEWQIAANTWIFDRLSFRGGLYESKASDNTWPDVTAMTWGIGTRLGKTWGFEFCYENRKMTLEQIEYEEEISLLSVAITRTF